MAIRRMLAKSIIESDMFSEMPAETQMLYVRLNLAADDDGFVSNPRQVMRMCGASEDSMKMLVNKKFVLTFNIGDNFIFLIKHWQVHNYIQKDRYKASTFKNILRDVYYDENKSYSLTPGEGKTPVLPPVSKVDTKCIQECIQDVSEMDTQVRLGKSKDSVSIGEESIDKVKDNNTLNNSFRQEDKIGDSKGEEESDLSYLPDDHPDFSQESKDALQQAANKFTEKQNKEYEERKAYYQKHITWYRDHNINTEYLIHQAAEEGITL